MENHELVHPLQEMLVRLLRYAYDATGYIGAIVNLETRKVEGCYTGFVPRSPDELEPAEHFVVAQIPPGFTNLKFASEALWIQLLDALFAAGLERQDSEDSLRDEHLMLRRFAAQAGATGCRAEEDWFDHRAAETRVRGHALAAGTGRQILKPYQLLGLDMGELG